MKFITLALTFFFLIACGGGSSSGVSTIHFGTYDGYARMTLRIAGSNFSDTAYGSVVFVIYKNGAVVSDPGAPFQGNGSMDGDTMVANVPGSAFNDEDFTCAGSIRFQGDIENGVIKGNISSSSFRCNNVNFVTTGTFTAYKRNTAKQDQTPALGLLAKRIQDQARLSQAN